MVGGTAYYAGKKVQQGRENDADQEARLEALEAQQAPPAPQSAPPPQYAAPPPAAAPAPAGGDDMVAQLERLKSLLDQGVLTPDEFQAAKQQVLNG
jgi:hypothetical protein